MKKTILSLIMLCCMTAVWAEGPGDGTKEKPYSGDWTASELFQKLKKGVHLAYDCVVTEGQISVRDTKLGKEVAMSWPAWSPGNLIGNPEPGSDYELYGKDNLPDDRKKHTFIVTDVSANNSTQYTIIGYFSGTYTAWREADGFFTVTTADALKYVIKKDNAAKVRLGADIYIGDMGKICDTFSGTITGEYDKVIPETNETQKSAHKLYGKRTSENTGSHVSSYLFDKVVHATFENIMFSNFRVEANDDNLGIIAKEASTSQFKNLMFVSNSLFNNDDYVGTVAGSASFCTFENVWMQNCDITTDGLYAGGIVGRSAACTFQKVVCGTTVYVFADGGGVNAYSGGITGYSNLDNFTNCVHMGMVGANDNYVGGMTGYSDESNFYSCSNSAVVATCKEATFGSMQKEREDALRKNLDEATIQKMVDNALAKEESFNWRYLVPPYWLGKLLRPFDMTSEDADVALFVFAGVELLFANMLAIIFCESLLPVALVVATGIYLYYEAIGDDYAGGIAGCAEKGTIEQCSNYGVVYAIDKFVGGIVGDASKMVINNCLNVGEVRQDREFSLIDGPYRIGGIISRGRDNTKVTNCLTTNRYPICGTRTDMNRLDQTSGNNYSFGRSNYDSEIDFLEKEVSQELLGGGLVALWLNNGVENREKGIMPWHQNLWSRPGSDGEEIDRDRYPVLDATHDEVNADLFHDSALSPYVHYIRNASQLKAFADLVNSGTSTNGHQFHIGYLEDDIHMEGEEWTPIGKNEDFKNFRGVFDGRGHTITGLTCSSTDQPVGLIGTAFANAEIRNVTVGEGSSFTCSGEAGAGAGGIVGKVGIRGRNWGTVVIENCGSHADINVYKHGGGILGNVDTPDDNTTIKVYVNNCYSMGTVTAEHGNSALLCGYTKNNGVVSNSWSGGQLRNGTRKDIWPYSIENMHQDAECLVGFYSNKLDIKDCYIVNPKDNVDRYEEEKEEHPLQLGVTIVSTEEAANGRLAYEINKNCDQTVLQQNIGKDTYPIFGDKGRYHTRKVSNQYGTACFPFPVKSDDKISYYYFRGSDDNSTLNFAYREEASPGIPVLYRIKEIKDTPQDMLPLEVSFNCDNENVISYRETPGSIRLGDDWHNVGTFEEKVFTETTETPSYEIYYLSNGAIRNGKTVTIAPYRAYFEGPNINDLQSSSGGSASIRIVVEDEDGETTAISLVNDNELAPSFSNTKTYSLMGTEVNDSYRGIVIRNGKKVLRK